MNSFSIVVSGIAVLLLLPAVRVSVGVAMAAIGGCAGFGAICGSSLATAATMAQVALP
jgi:TRAP-type C4-dicarboxylate transport system permease large subunit